MSFPLARWVLEPPPDRGRARALARALSIPETLAALLVQRGLGEPATAKAFLRPELGALADPHSLAGMADAVAAVADAARRGVPVLVHGDYDVDGQCAAALLTRALRIAGVPAHGFVPHRLRDGYDFGPAGLARARELGAGLIITCDCGTTAVEAVREAEASGIRVVVTDHHLCPPELPPATALLNPQRPDDTSGLGMLCGAGIAFKLVQALVPALGLPVSLPHHLLDYAALATVADVVPLVGENRILVRHGLRLLRETRWPGLRALLATSGLQGELRAGQVGFILAPRLNAAGRIGEAQDGLRLLLSDDPDEAHILAGRLARLNAERQALDQRILDEAVALVEQAGDLDRRAAIVLAAEGWHPGVVGIVASRLVERYGRPAFLVCLEPDGTAKGSGRSISRFNLHEALTRCADVLDRYGGHRMAAGLSLRRDNVAAFQARFEAVAAAELPVAELGPEQRVDLEIDLAAANGDLERLCRHLEPCGMGNPAPVFGVRGVGFASRQRVGANHLRGILRAGDGGLGAIGFQLADRVPWLADDPVDAAFRLEQNEYRGISSLQARLVSLTPHRRPVPAS